MEKGSLKNKTISGTIWSAIDAFISQGISFLIGIVLARLIAPEEYGLIGICLIFNGVLNGIVDSGFSNALIRKKDVTNADYNTMFIINFIVSIVLYFLLFISAPYISNFFSNTGLTTLIRVTGLLLVINALSITHFTILTKNVNFKSKSIVSFISACISGIIGIIMAFQGYGVWALVFQLIFKQVFYTVGLWLIIKWYPSFYFSKSSFLYMWGYGSKLLISGLLNNIWNQINQIVVGKFYSPSALGQYTKSNEYASIFSSNLTLIIQRVSFPILSEIQDDKERLLLAYRKVIKITMFVTAVSMIYLAAIAEPFICTLIGNKWHQAATFLPLICVSMSLYPLHAINLNMLQVMGRSDIFLYLEIIKKIIGVIPICIGIFISIYWMLFTSIITGFIGLYVNTWYTGKKLGYSFFMQLQDIYPSYTVAAVVALPVYFLKYLPMPSYEVLILQIVVGFILGIVVCEVCKIQEYLELKKIFFSYFIKGKSK